MSISSTEANRPRRGFASDNTATVHPEVVAKLAAVNAGHAFGYGHDPYTAAVERKLLAELGAPAGGVAFVFNGTGANVLCIRAACRPWQGVICAESAHINNDEGGAPEIVAGVKLLTVPAEHGKLTVDSIRGQMRNLGDEHSVQPRLVSVTQATEFGSLYTVDELRALSEYVHANDLLLHMDGARLANACAALGVSLQALSTDVGVDILSFGGTKNGIMFGEAVVALRPELAHELPYLRKQTTQLASKMRYLAAQFDALLTDELWLRNAAHANAMAARLAAAVQRIDGVELIHPVQANEIFARLPVTAAQALLRERDFYLWDEAAGEVRWVCSWDTTVEDVDSFTAAVTAAVAESLPLAGRNA